MGAWVDAVDLQQPWCDGSGDVSACCTYTLRKLDGVEPGGSGGAVGAFFGVVGTLDDVAADQRICGRRETGRGYF